MMVAFDPFLEYHWALSSPKIEKSESPFPPFYGVSLRGEKRCLGGIRPPICFLTAWPKATKRLANSSWSGIALV
jgi:hypothetical protein